MGKILLLILLASAGTALFFAPWITALAYVANSLLQPQYLWPWIFDGIPIYRITAGLAILGFFLTFAQKEQKAEIYKNKQNLMLIVIWIWMHISHFLSPYKGAQVSVSPDTVLNTINSIMIMYFVLLPMLTSEKALRFLCYIFIGVGVYYIYWANSAYLNQEWYRFVGGRLTGPNLSPYQDNNVLSTLIIMCLPFITLLFLRVNKKIYKVLIFFAVILAWHSLILFGSRAALLAATVIFLLLGFIVKSKKFNIAIAITFVLFMVYQGSLLIDRTTDTIEIATVQPDKPINPRLVSWEVGLKLIPEYPIFGAGVQMFEAAARNHFPGKTPHVAHNTFINFSANTGLLTGILFLGLVYLSWKRLLWAKNQGYDINDDMNYALIASSISLIAFFVCSIFLDLIIYEPFYFVLLINIISWQVITFREKEERENASDLLEKI